MSDYPSENQVLQGLARMARAKKASSLRQQCAELCEQLAEAEGVDYFGDMAADFIVAELEQIQRAKTLERARYYLARLQKAATESKPAPYSDLDLNRWKQYDDIETDSLWDFPTRDRSGSHTADYWGNFIPQIPNQLIRRFTRKGEWVVDGFAGSGTTLIECLRLGRNCLGVELQTDRAAETRRIVRQEPNPHDVSVRVRQGDTAKFPFVRTFEELEAPSAQLVLLHPPYHDIIRFSDSPSDLSNAPTGEAFVEGLAAVAERTLTVLDRDRYLALVIGDKYADGEWVPLGYQSMDALQRLGLKLKSIIVKNFDKTAGKRGQEELWRYRALAGGFYVFKHEYVFLFQRK